MADYLMYKENINVNALKEAIANKVIYFSSITSGDKNNKIAINVESGKNFE